MTVPSLQSPRRQRALVLLNKSPVPDRTGSRRRNLRLLTAASEAFDVVVVIMSTVLSEEDRHWLATVSLPPTHVFELTPARSGRPAQVRGLLSRRTPYSHSQFDLPGARRRLHEVMTAFAPDVVWSSNAIAGEMLLTDATAPIVVDAAHFEREWLKHQFRRTVVSAGQNRSAFRSNAVLALDSPARISAEARAFRSASLVTACSTIEAEIASALTSCPVITIRNGVDLPETLGWSAGSHRLLFVGNFGYTPNSDGATRLARDILPEIQRQLPSATLDLVGQEPERLEHLKDLPGVTVHGFARELDAFYRGAELVVAPIDSGSGTKSKVLEAFAHGVPVVTTPTGIAGIDVQHGLEVRIGTGNAEIVRASVELMGNPDLALSQRDAARAWVENGNDWGSIGKQFCAALQGTITQR